MMIGSACIPSSCGGRCSSYRPRGGVFERPRRRRAANERDEVAPFHCPKPSRASDRKDSTPRHGKLLHPSSWAERDDRDHAAENFFQGGSPKQATPFPRQDLPTARNRF